MTVHRLIATFFGAGTLRPAPGTWGSLAALPAAWVLHVAAGPWALVAGIFLATGLGVWATTRMIQETGRPDPSEVVIDEVAGMWIALLPLSFGASRVGVDITVLWPGWVVAFGLFRLFDIWKPGPIGWADRQKGAWGVMLDDLFAGAAAACGVLIGAWLAHGAPL